MTFSLIQYSTPDGARAVGFIEDGAVARRVLAADTVLTLAGLAIESGQTLIEVITSGGLGEEVDYDEVALLPPIDHPDPAHLHLTGTGLTHLGSAEGRDAMHREAMGDATTDSMRMFLMGVDGGKPEPGKEGVQPEWFYKGDGSSVVASGTPLVSPAFALHGGEEPEIAGVYLIGPDGTPFRLGYTMANEFSDHIMERENYLWLAHSKIRPAALGPELLIGELPHNVSGSSKIIRDGKTLWEKPFVSGEENMSHSLSNLEHHHFKHGLFRRPGDIHVHFFGTATLSFSDGIMTQPGDIFEIVATPFTLPLRNAVAVAPPVSVEIATL